MQDGKDLILNLLKTKSVLKQDVYDNTLRGFGLLKQCASGLIDALNKEVKKHDERLSLEFTDCSPFHFDLKVAGDQLVFAMHTNVFQFDKNHHLWQTRYFKEDENRSFFGQINVYNFLSDSFKYSRVNDIGYLIARIFINKENQLIIEGKKFINEGFQHPDIKQADNPSFQLLLCNLIRYAMEFDLYAQPFATIPEISVADVIENTNLMKLSTAKRLGYKFHAEELPHAKKASDTEKDNSKS